MYPQQQPQNQDVLSKLLANKKLLFLIIGGVVVVLLVIVTLAANSGNPTPGRVVATQAHLTALADLAKEKADSLNNADLRGQNANLTILISGAVNDIAAVALKQYGAVEADPQTLARQAARLAVVNTATAAAINTNTVDKEYQTQMLAELRIIDTELASLSTASGSTVSQVLTAIRERLSQGRQAFEAVKL